MEELKDMDIDYHDASPEDVALWYEQLAKLSDKHRSALVTQALRNLEEVKPITAKFIKNFKCKLVGFCPRVEYALHDSRSGETDVTWVHSFSIPTLLYWCPEGQFGFFVNANMKYDDTVLNSIRGNKKQKLRGFTA